VSAGRYMRWLWWPAPCSQGDSCGGCDGQHPLARKIHIVAVLASTLQPAREVHVVAVVASTL
jgi:hypothetical protein